MTITYDLILFPGLHSGSNGKQERHGYLISYSGMNMLNNCDIIKTVARDQWFDRTVNAHVHHQQVAYKEDEQTVEIDTEVILSSTKTGGWSGLKISFHERNKVTKDGSYLREIIMMDSTTTINLFVNPSMITNIRKSEMPMNVLTNSG